MTTSGGFVITLTNESMRTAPNFHEEGQKSIRAAIVVMELIGLGHFCEAVLQEGVTSYELLTYDRHDFQRLGICDKLGERTRLSRSLRIAFFSSPAEQRTYLTRRPRECWSNFDWALWRWGQERHAEN